MKATAIISGVLCILVCSMVILANQDQQSDRNGQSSQRSETKVQDPKTKADQEKKVTATDANPGKYQYATFGAGCFWCVEAVFQRLDGVIKVESGYSNGHVADPTYKEVCSGNTGHAEVCRVQYDPAVISFAELLEVFWTTHDPTTLNRQGADYGTQYRSGIYYHSDEQKKLAETYKTRLNDENVFGKPVVTEIVAAEKFYPAEDYHQDYFNQNPNAGYCRAVIVPKIQKFKKIFADKLKKDVKQK